VRADGPYGGAADDRSRGAKAVDSGDQKHTTAPHRANQPASIGYAGAGELDQLIGVGFAGADGRGGLEPRLARAAPTSGTSRIEFEQRVMVEEIRC
jgi:hypothetical protein